MNTSKKIVYRSLFSALIAALTFGFSACAVDDLEPGDPNEVVKVIILRNFDDNTEKTHKNDYSESSSDGYVNFYAASDDGSSIGISLADPEGDGVGGTDVPLDDQDFIDIHHGNGKNESIKEGTYTYDPISGIGKITGKSDLTGKTWEITLDKIKV